MILATDTTDFASGALGLVELALSYLNDRKKKYFSKSEVVEYLNQEQLKTAHHINRLYETYFVKSATTTTVEDQVVYALPTDLVQLLGLEYADSVGDNEKRKLTEVHVTDAAFYQGLAKANAKEDMQVFFVSGTQFEIAPVENGGKTIRTHYVKRLAALVNNSDVSEVPIEHHEILALGAARRGRLKLGRGNPEVERGYAEAVELLNATIRRFSPQREETASPFWATGGPVPEHPGTQS